MHKTDLCYRLFVCSLEAGHRPTEAQGVSSTLAVFQSSYVAHITTSFDIFAEYLLFHQSNHPCQLIHSAQ